jgi:hypothetical protein
VRSGVRCSGGRSGGSADEDRRALCECADGGASHTLDCARAAQRCGDAAATAGVCSGSTASSHVTRQRQQACKRQQAWRGGSAAAANVGVSARRKSPQAAFAPGISARPRRRLRHSDPGCSVRRRQARLASAAHTQ